MCRAPFFDNRCSTRFPPKLSLPRSPPAAFSTSKSKTELTHREVCRTSKMSHDLRWRGSCSNRSNSPCSSFGKSYDSTRRDSEGRWLWRLVRRRGAIDHGTDNRRDWRVKLRDRNFLHQATCESILRYPAGQALENAPLSGGYPRSGPYPAASPVCQGTLTRRQKRQAMSVRSMPAL